MPPVLTPTVHPKGTPRVELIHLRSEVAISLHEALRGLKAMAPNPRDYVGQPDIFQAAGRLHTKRVKAVNDLLEDIHAEIQLLSTSEPT